MIFSFLFKNKISDIYIFSFIKEILKLLDCIQRSKESKFLVIGKPRYLIGWKCEYRRWWEILPHTGRKAHFFHQFPFLRALTTQKTTNTYGLDGIVQKTRCVVCLRLPSFNGRTNNRYVCTFVFNIILDFFLIIDKLRSLYWKV